MMSIYHVSNSPRINCMRPDTSSVNLVSDSEVMAVSLHYNRDIKLSHVSAREFLKLLVCLSFAQFLDCSWAACLSGQHCYGS